MAVACHVCIVVKKDTKTELCSKEMLSLNSFPESFETIMNATVCIVNGE